MNTFPIPIRATDGDYDELDFPGDDLSAAHDFACDELAGTRWTPEPLPTTCPVRLALREVRAAQRGVDGSAALWGAQEHPDRARALAGHLQALSNAATEALTTVAATLPKPAQAAE